MLQRWVLLAYRLPREPSTPRIALWRKLRAENDEAGYSRDLWRDCAEAGWAGILVPEAYGGLDFGLVGAGLVAREMGRTLAASPCTA